MGCYDTVLVPCPQCGEEYGAQSKSGPGALATYSLKNAPTEILANVNRHAPFTCSVCDCVFRVELTVTATVVRIPTNKYETGEW